MAAAESLMLFIFCQTQMKIS